MKLKTIFESISNILPILILGLGLGFVAYLALAPGGKKIGEEIGIAKRIVSVPTRTGTKLRMVVELPEGNEIEVGFNQSELFVANSKVRLLVFDEGRNRISYHFDGFIRESTEVVVNNESEE